MCFWLGVYSVDIDAKQGRVKIFGEVDPNTLLKALARTGRHAKLEWAKLNHPLVNRTYHHGHGGSYGYNNSSASAAAAAALEDPYYTSYYGGRRAILPPTSSWHDHHDQYYNPITRFAPTDYPSSSYYYSDYGGHTAAAARHVPSYPQPIYDPYQDDSISPCSIMWSYHASNLVVSYGYEYWKFGFFF